MNQFVEGIDTLHVLANKCERMKRDIHLGEYGDQGKDSMSGRTTEKMIADLDDMSCRIRLAIRKIMESESVD